MPADRPVRVAFVDHCAQISGGEVALVRLVEALGDAVEAHVLLGEPGPIAAQLTDAGACVEVLPMAAGLRDTKKDTVRPAGVGAAAARELASYVALLTRRLRALEPDVVHTNSLKAALYGGLAGRAARRPVLWHVRDRIAPDYLPRPAVALVRGLSLALPTAVVTNSRATAQTLPRRSTVLYDAVAEAPERPRPVRPEGSPHVVGMLGRLSPWKGQHVFLEAFARAHADDGAQARLIGSAMFGEDDYEARLRALAIELGIADRVEFRGFRSDVPAELDALDVLVHASTVPEPFGQVVIEGMAAGVPVVAAAAGGPAEVVTDGVDGLLTPPGDAGTLAAALRRLAGDAALRDRLGSAGRATSRGYRPEVVADGMREVYARLVAARR